MLLFTKTCSKCKQSLPFDSFHADSRTADGLQRWCKSCRVEWRSNLPYQQQERMRQREEENRAIRKAIRKAVCKKCNQEYEGLKCLPCAALYMREWNEKNRDRVRARKAQKHKQRKLTDANYLPSRRARGNKHRQLLKQEVFERMGDKCYCCGLDDQRFLTVEHLNNDGCHYRHPNGKRLGGVWLYKWIKDNNYPSDIVLACYNCNMARQHAGKGGICPHQEGLKRLAA